MKIKFFTEGGKNIGFGHINRCLSLAQAFSELNDECEFYISGDNSILYMIKDFDVNINDLNSDQKNILQKINPEDIIVIDSYKAPQSLINNIAKINNNLVFFDDYNRINYPVGIVINGALNAESIYSNRNPKLKYLLGGKFQTIRKEFWNVKILKKNSNINNVLTTFGGDDSRNLTPRVMEFLNEHDSNITKNVIVGSSFTNTEIIEKSGDSNTKLIFNPKVDQIIQLMLEADLAICGAGQTLYELARTKTPSLFVGIAENQKNNIKSWSNFPYFSFVGWWNSDDIIGRLHQSFIKFDKYFKQIAEDINSSDFLINGSGSKNIVKEVLSYVRTK